MVTFGSSFTAESSERKGKTSAGKKMGKVKRDIHVYWVMSETSSALLSASLKGSGLFAALVPAPVIAASAAPIVDSSVAAVRSSPDKTADGDDHLSTVGPSDPDISMVSLPAAPSPLGTLTVGDPGIVDASERPPASGSRKRKRTFVFEDPDSSLKIRRFFLQLYFV